MQTRWFSSCIWTNNNHLTAPGGRYNSGLYTHRSLMAFFFSFATAVLQDKSRNMYIKFTMMIFRKGICHAYFLESSVLAVLRHPHTNLSHRSRSTLRYF